MSIYSKDGNQLSGVYSLAGSRIQSAYSIDGSIVFPDSSIEPITLKVMSYNVGGWYIGSGRNVPSSVETEYLALQTGMIEQNDPDVLVIQEYLQSFSDSGTSAQALLESLFPYVHVKSSGTYFGRAICSKYPITNYTERYYSAESSRYFDSCTITVDEIPITFVNTHLGLTIANRQSEIAQLILFLSSQEEFVSCGDYNMLDCKGTDGEDYAAIIQPILNAGFNSANCTDYGFLESYSDQPTGAYTGCLDNIVTSSNIQILDAFVDETKLNDAINEKVDHMPLIATLQIGG